MQGNCLHSPNIRRHRTIKTVEQITHIITRQDPSFVRSLPIRQHIVHNGTPSDEDVLHARLKALLVGIQQVKHLRLTRRCSVEIGGCPHDGYPAVVDAAREVAAQKHLEMRVVFLLRGAVVRGAVRQEERVVREGVAERAAAPVDVAGAGGADHDAWGLVGGRVGVGRAVGGGAGGVV